MADLENPVFPASCVHRWRITSPVGDQCSGTCSVCGAVRAFTNERRPFGQPGRGRRPAPRVQPIMLHRAFDAGMAAQFLTTVEPSIMDGVRPE